MFELTEQEYREIAERQAQRRGEAWDWLAGRFSNVREEEISDSLARDIELIQEWDKGCAYCTDLKSCGHSCAVLEICEEGISGGGREFVTRARPCDLMKTEKERREMMNPARKGRNYEQRL